MVIRVGDRGVGLNEPALGVVHPVFHVLGDGGEAVFPPGLFLPEAPAQGVGFCDLYSFLVGTGLINGLTLGVEGLAEFPRPGEGLAHPALEVIGLGDVFQKGVDPAAGQVLLREADQVRHVSPGVEAVVPHRDPGTFAAGGGEIPVGLAPLGRGGVQVVREAEDQAALAVVPPVREVPGQVNPAVLFADRFTLGYAAGVVKSEVLLDDEGGFFLPSRPFNDPGVTFRQTALVVVGSGD